MKSPIIDRPDLQTVGQRTISGVLTLAVWMVWSYLWLPVLALFAWALGVQQAYKYMILLGGYQEVLQVLGLYMLIIGVLCGGLYAWATYSILRFGGVERRIGRRTPPLEAVARYFRQDPEEVDTWQRAQRLHVTHDETGNIARVEILPTGTAVPESPTEALRR